jgi:hypothetical protein
VIYGPGLNLSGYCSQVIKRDVLLFTELLLLQGSEQ